MFFFLVQSEQGDIFKVTLEADEDMVGFYVHVLFEKHMVLRVFVFFKKKCHSVYGVIHLVRSPNCFRQTISLQRLSLTNFIWSILEYLFIYFLFYLFFI